MCNNCDNLDKMCAHACITLSATSIFIIREDNVLQTHQRREVMSCERVQVCVTGCIPDTMCTPFSNFLISSPTLFPPMHEWICTLIKSPNARPTFWICWANSRVGERIRACVSRRVVSMDCNTLFSERSLWWVVCMCVNVGETYPMENVAVLPVPDWACAITSRPLITGTIARCWMAEGFSKPIRYKTLVPHLRADLHSLCKRKASTLSIDAAHTICVNASKEFVS